VFRTHGELSVNRRGRDRRAVTYIRPGTMLGADGKLGAFVETKNFDDRDRHQGAAPDLRRRRDSACTAISAPPASLPITTVN
jgi:hypothetical protein